MIELPKRNDYKEIEGFKDYEFTNCIAYEMAIRNEKIKNKISEYFLFNGYYDFSNVKLFKNFNKYGFNSECILSYCLGNYDKALKVPVFANKTKSYFDTRIIKNVEDKENINTSIFVKSSNTDDYYFEKLEINKNNINIDCIPSLECKYSRPKLTFQESKIVEVKLNFNLPKDELIAYISKIKDDYDKDNSIIKTPLELLGEDFEKADNKKINKKLIADKFFIYDYVTARQEQIKEMNEEIIQEYQEKIQELKNSTFISGKDRTIQIKELKKELDENIINTKVDDIFKDIKYFTPATVKRYYYDMKPFIDDLKYKELITGTI